MNALLILKVKFQIVDSKIMQICIKNQVTTYSLGNSANSLIGVLVNLSKSGGC